VSSRRNIGLGLAALLFLVGALLRLIGLEHNPPGLWQDEASTGVDAFLLWTTGKDRAGVTLPLVARSFGDYPLALYRYLDAPIVGVFGLSIAKERIVAAITGSTMIALAAKVVQRRLGNETALCFLVVAGLCPTWIHFSRYGSEAILMPATLVLGWLLIELGGEAEKRWALWLGALSLGACAYTYHAVKLFLPLWMAGFVVYRLPLIRELWKKERLHLFGPMFVFALAVAPSVWIAFTPEGLARPNTVVAWKHREGALEIAMLIANNYLSYFDPGMLFVRGGPAVAQSIPYLGIWNLIELPLMIAGLIAIARQTRERRFFAFVLFWFVLGPLPGGITYETQNIGRAIGWLPAPQILSAHGMAVLLASGKKWVAGALAIGWLGTAIAVAVLLFDVYPDITQRDWQWEVSGAMKCAKAKRRDEKLIVSPHFHMASVFGMFHLNDLAWELGERKEVTSGELYLFPAARSKPTKGQELCAIVIKSSGKTVSYVYGPP
jgi:hypothetical protein